MKRIAVLAGLAVVSLGLAGCQSIYGGGESVSPAPQQQVGGGIEGAWVDPNTGFVSTFSNGTFETRTTDSNSVVATGTYAYTSDNVVTLSLHSRVRADSTVNCALAGGDRLNCTSSTGQHFSLARTNAPQPVQPAG